MNGKKNEVGWTKCHRKLCSPKVYRWKDVTCKQCLKYKPIIKKKLQEKN